MTTTQEFESFIPVYDTAPKEQEKLREFLVEQLKRISNGVNSREIGQYYDVEVLSGKELFPGTATPEQNRQVFRKVIDFGALPNTMLKAVDHGITFDVNFSLLHLYAGATNPVNFLALQIPYSSNTANADIELSMTSTKINITTAINYSAYTRCFVVVEYTQEQ